MKIRLCFLIFSLVAVGLLVLLGGMRSALAPKLVRFEGETMGTVWRASVIDDGKNPISKEKAQKIQAALEDALKAVDFRMSTWKEFTELSRINAQESIEDDFKLSPEMALVLGKALEISQKTDGAYDVTIGPLVDLWKFGPSRDNPDLPDIPDDDAIQNAKSQMGFKALELIQSAESESVFLARKKEGLRIDLSSIAKGYGVDCAAETLKKLGFDNFLVEVGGEVRASGTNHMENPWRLGIELPVPGSNLLFGTVELSGNSLATSGDYRNFRMEGNKRRSHLIDPRAGKPVEHSLVSVSVLAPDCMTADAWATAFMVLGPDEGQKIAERERLQVLFLIQEGEEITPLSVGFPVVPNPYLKKDAEKH